ncbi:MAG: ABC transporter ATP-binding protein [Cyanobacteria bacterium J06635_15]
MAQVQLENITRRFGNTTAIADISFKVPDGAFWVLVGPSGCGKSTLLRIIAGLEMATEGKLYIGDRLVNQVPARQRDVAMVFQNYALYPHMTVAQNLAFGLRLRQTPPAAIRDRVEAVARSLDIAHLLQRKPSQVSGGQQQRVALGRAIARSPQVFLLDEPLSNLDAQLRDDTRTELKQLHQQFGITTLYVTHDQVEAMTLADQIVVLDGGTVQQMGAPQEIYAHPANRMVATFLGSPPMNLMDARFEHSHFVVDGQALPCPAAITQTVKLTAGQRIHLGIRPEQVQLTPTSETPGLQVQVSVVEPLGKETLIRGEISTSDRTLPQTLAFMVPMDITIKPGDRIKLQLNSDRFFLFDTNTGDRLYPPPITPFLCREDG